VTVAATATAEAYNPSGLIGRPVIPVAPLCVKPWLLPNLDPTQAAGGTNQIFTPATGAITAAAAGLVGKKWPDISNPALNQAGLYSVCGDCSPGGGGIPAPVPGQYYPGAIDAADFPAPTQALPTCSAGLNPDPSKLAYQLAVAGCVPRPIPCGATATIGIDTNPYAPNTRDADAAQAVSCLIHDNGAVGDTDSVDYSAVPSPPPFQFRAGTQNPVANAVGKNVLVSDSVVTIPVYDTTAAGAPPATATVTVIGFLQVFLGSPSTTTTPPNFIPATIINMVGCGQTVVTPPILGNGASPVPVRLVSPQ
jgi:hypothetical protein